MEASDSLASRPGCFCWLKRRSQARSPSRRGKRNNPSPCGAASWVVSAPRAPRNDARASGRLRVEIARLRRASRVMPALGSRSGAGRSGDRPLHPEEGPKDPSSKVVFCRIRHDVDKSGAPDLRRRGDLCRRSKGGELASFLNALVSRDGPDGPPRHERADVGGSCPTAWRSSGGVGAEIAGMGRAGQAATAGSPTMGSSLKGAMVSRVM